MPVYYGHGQYANALLGHYRKELDSSNALAFLGPLALRCSSCERVMELFDQDRHAYDGELNGVTGNMRVQTERVVFQCEECGPQPLRVWVRFEYPGDLFDEGFMEARGREQDLFSWSSVVGRCPRCSRVLPVMEFECA
jgi:hypothetical protein